MSGDKCFCVVKFFSSPMRNYCDVFHVQQSWKHATGAFRGIEDGKVSWLCDDWPAIANQMALIKIVSCGQTVSFGTVKNAGVPTCTEVLFGARDERSVRPTQSDSRRSCAESARIVAAAPRASVLASRRSADLQISEQHRRARSSGDQATLCVDGWVQVVRERGHHARWHRVGRSHSQGTILVWPRRDQDIPRCTRTHESYPQRKDTRRPAPR